MLRVLGEAAAGLLPVALAWVLAVAVAVVVWRRSRGVAVCLVIGALLGLSACAADLAGPLAWLWNKGNLGPGMPLYRVAGVGYAAARCLQALAVLSVMSALVAAAWARPEEPGAPAGGAG